MISGGQKSHRESGQCGKEIAVAIKGKPQLETEERESRIGQQKEQLNENRGPAQVKIVEDDRHDQDQDVKEGAQDSESKHAELHEIEVQDFKDPGGENNRDKTNAALQNNEVPSAFQQALDNGYVVARDPGVIDVALNVALETKIFLKEICFYTENKNGHRGNDGQVG